MFAFRSTAVLSLLGLAIACSPDQIEPTSLEVAPSGAVLPVYLYKPQVFLVQGWFADVNDSNLAVGMGNGRAIAVKIGASLIYLSNSPGVWARAWGVNAPGEVVGNVDIGTLTQPQTVPAYWPDVYSKPVLLSYAGEASDINDQGFAVGTVSIRGRGNQGFVWETRNGTLHPLPPLPGAVESSAIAINNDFVVLGWSDGIYLTLWRRSGSGWSPKQVVGGIEGFDLDAGNGIVGVTNGRASFGDPNHAGYFTTVGQSYATAVTGNGLAAGYDHGVPAPWPYGNSMTAFVADQSGATTYLPYPPSIIYPWKASLAFGLNKCGVVVGQLWDQLGANPVIWDPGC